MKILLILLRYEVGKVSKQKQKLIEFSVNFFGVCKWSKRAFKMNKFFQDLVDRNITIMENSYEFPTTKKLFYQLNMTDWSILADRMISYNNPYQRIEFLNDLIDNGTLAIWAPDVSYEVHELHHRYKVINATWEKWWKSKDFYPGYNYAGYVTRRKWVLQEVIIKNK